jgi:DNA-binding ferritin-like protein (Dps family)
MNFWETITGSDLTREWKAFEARAEALPADYRAAQCHLVRGDCQDVDGWRAGVFGGGVCGAFEAVAVDVETFDCAWDAAVAAGRVGSFGDFSDGSCAGGF